MDVYFPRTAVSQVDLEQFDGVSPGKYTNGLGQESMSFVGDREDIVSICLTAVQQLIEKYNIDPMAIGRLEVGTETLIDKSKSVKTYLMDLFTKCGNMDIEGIDTVNACYGGTNALFNAVNWIESSSWDGRLALVVAGDIAVYARGPARPTGGCGAIAMLIGPNAPLVLESGIRGTHMENAYDFYKPDHHVEYPTVDGKLSISCYLRALDFCYDRFTAKFGEKAGKEFSLDDIDYFVFHSPYNGLVKKSVARLLLNDFLKHPERPEYTEVQRFGGIVREESYANKQLDQVFAKLSKPLYDKKTKPSELLPKELGNIYCGSVYAGLMSVIHCVGEGLIGKRIVLFSYGSGLAATMFSIRCVSSVQHINGRSELEARLAQREFVDPADFHAALDLRERVFSSPNWRPVNDRVKLFPGTYYLRGVDEQYRRSYGRTPLSKHWTKSKL